MGHMNDNPILNLPVKAQVRLAQEVVAVFSTEELERFLVEEHGQAALDILEENESFLGILAGNPLDKALQKDKRQ